MRLLRINAGIEWFTYLDGWVNDSNNHRDRMPNTVLQRQYSAKKIKEYCQNMPIGRLTTEDLQTCLDGMKRDGLSCTSINKSRELIRMVWASAVKAHKVDPEIVTDLKGVRMKHPEKIIPDADTAKKIKEYCRGKVCQGYRLAEFLLYTGCRVGEARMVTWEDVSEDFIVIRNIKDHGPDKSTRRVPISDSLRCLLRRMGNLDSGPLFKVRDARKPLESISRHLRLDGEQKLTHHKLRHLFITRAVEAGADMQTIARWVGHKDLTMITQIYYHLRDEHSKNEMEKLKL